MTDWFIRNDDDPTEIGPLRPSELLAMVRDGSVTHQTMLRKNDSSWFPASDVGGLFEAAMRPTIEFFCPKCKKEIAEPPIHCHHCGHEVLAAIAKITENTIVDRLDQSFTSQAGNSVKRWLAKKRIAKDKPKDGN